MPITPIKFNLESKRQLLLLGITLSLTVAIFFMQPIAQDVTYHQFADQNTLFFIPNFWNVISNIPFILVGLIGLAALGKSKEEPLPGSLAVLRVIYSIFFIGLVFTGVGSSYYHWNPDNSTLVWDRLPMTISFTAFFAVILGENISTYFAKKVLYPLLFVGIFSVVYWVITENKGAGDLRLYILIQFLPMILTPLILWLYSSPFTGQGYIVAVLFAYVCAKLLEHFDKEVFEIIGFLSGHSLKHIVAALGTFYFYLALKKRRIR